MADIGFLRGALRVVGKPRLPVIGWSAAHPRQAPSALGWGSRGRLVAEAHLFHLAGDFTFPCVTRIFYYSLPPLSTVHDTGNT